MAKFFKKSTALVLALLMVTTTMLSFTVTVDAKRKPKKYVKSIKVKKKKVRIKAGKTLKVKVTVKTVKKASKKFKVKSSKKSVATVKVSGKYVKIRAKKSGKATITVTTKAKGKKGKKLKAKIKVTVYKPKKSKSKRNSSSGDSYDYNDNDKENNPKDSDDSNTNNNTDTNNELTAIYLNALPETITVGATSQIQVLSATDGVAIKKIEYKSSNEMIATVDNNGVVTGHLASVAPVEIIVKAYDANGNCISGKVSITVTGNLDSNASISEVPDSFVIGPGETRQLNPVAENAEPNPVFLYSSDNAKVASVDDKGVITANSAGEARITVTIAGTTAQKTCIVTVKNERLGIKSFKATHAKILTIGFTTSVSEENRDKINIVIKKGSTTIPMDFDWDKSGMFVNCTTNANLDETNCTATISSDTVPINPDKNTASYRVEKNEIKAVRITSARVPHVNGAKIYFDAIDNYGDKMENTSAGKFNWKISCSDPQVKTALIEQGIRNNNDYISLTNFGSKDLGVKVDETVIGVQAILKDDSGVTSGSVKVAVKSLKIDKVDIIDIVLEKGAKHVYEDTSPKTYTLKYVAVDNYGDPVDWSLYYPGSENSAYNNKYEAYSDNEDVVSKPVMENENQLKVTVQANKPGTANVYIIAESQDYKKYKIEVFAKPRPLKIKFPDSKEHSIVAGEDEAEKVPVSFIDQYNEEMAPGSVTQNEFKKAFGTPRLSDENLIVNYVSDNSGDFVTFNAKNLTSETKDVKVTFQAYDENENLISSTFTINVDPERRPDTIRFISDVPDSIVKGESVNLKFYIQDNRGKIWKDTNKVSIELLSDNTTYIVLSDLTFNDDGTGTMTITGVGESSGNNDPYVSLMFKMRYMGKEISATTFEPYKLIVYGNLDEIKVNTNVAADESIKSGQSIEITLTAYNNNKILDTYNRTYKDVKFTQYDEIEGKTSDSLTQYAVVEFVNGVANVSLVAQKSGDIVFEADIPAVAKGTINVKTAPAIKVNAGNPAKYAIRYNFNKTGLVVTCYDNNDNIVKDYNPSEGTYITVTNPSYPNMKASQYFNNVDSLNGKVGDIEFVNGIATVSVKSSIPNGTEITVKTGSISQTITT